MKRKLLSLILVVAMLASVAVFTPSASAAESLATYEFSDVAGTPGDTVVVDFKVTTAALSGLQFMFEYDSSRLTFDGIDWAPANDAFGEGFPADLTGNEVLGPAYTQVGPYKILAWATGIGVGAVDLSAGVVLAQLTFTIKEDAPLGDAYVKIAPLAEGVMQPNKITTGTGDLIGESMTFVDGAVTVLPATSPAPVEIPVEDLAIDEGYLYEISGSWADYPGVLTLPADAGIEGIDYFTFESFAMCGFVIPESVVEVVGGAFNNCRNLSKVYVLNAAAELDEQAIGFDGTAGRKGYNYDGVMLLNDEDNPITTIYGAAGSTAETYATTGDGSKAFPFVASVPEFQLTIGDKTYMAAAETVAPGVSVIDGATVVAWTDGTNTYAAGAAMTLTGDVTLEPVTITAPVTSTEADFKLAANEADLAMRFTATLSKADYATLASLGTVELGMLITPAKYVSLAGSFTKAALDTIGAANGAYVDIAIDGYYQETADDYILAGSLKGFSAKTLAKNPDFASVVYATVTTAEGDVFTVYGDFNHAANQNVKTVAEAIVATNITNTQKGWLNTLIGKFGA